MMSHPERQELEMEEEATMQLRIVVKDNIAPNGVPKKYGHRVGPTSITTAGIGRVGLGVAPPPVGA